jgi:hypothetical protein
MQDLDLGLLIYSEKWLVYQNYPEKIQQIEKHLQLLQQQQKEKQDQQVINSRIVSEKKIKNRQSSLSEFID